MGSARRSLKLRQRQPEERPQPLLGWHPEQHEHLGLRKLPRPVGRALTFLDDVDDVIGIEAEFICVLRVIGIQGLALWHLRLGLGLGLGSAPRRGRPAARLPPDTAEKRQEEGAERLWVRVAPAAAVLQ